MKRRLSWLVIPFLGALAVGCGSSSPAQGGVGQACYANGSCNAGLTCFSKLCVDTTGAGGAAGATGTAGAAGTGAAGATGTAGAAGTGAAGATGTGGAAGTGVAGAGGAAGAGGTAGAGGAAFSVASLPGLALWLDAGKGTTVTSNSVTLWKDQSTNGNDAAPMGTTPPQLVSGAINGLPAIAIAQSATMATGSNGSASLGFGLGDCLVEVVAKWNDSSVDATFMFQTFSGGATGIMLFSDGSNQASVGIMPNTSTQVVSTTGTPPGNGAFHLFGGRRTGTGAATTVDVRLNGTVAGTTSGANFALDLGSIAGVVIGGGPSLQIAEIVAVKGTISAADLASLEAYLKTKYGL
jgi:hypothetical protein